MEHGSAISCGEFPHVGGNVLDFGLAVDFWKNS